MVSIAKVTISPIKNLIIVADKSGLKEMHINREPSFVDSLKSFYGGTSKEGFDTIEKTISSLEKYFKGEFTSFDNIPLNPDGTSFLKNAWNEMRGIGWGKAITYGGLASRLGTIALAVGSVCSRNRIPIIIPCHRVLGAENKLYAYGWGLEVKKYLLELEGWDVEDTPDLKNARVRRKG